MQAEERKYSHDDDHQANQIYNAVHNVISCDNFESWRRVQRSLSSSVSAVAASVEEERQQNDDWNWHAQHPQQNPTSHRHSPVEV
jgi:hypothetical protein